MVRGRRKANSQAFGNGISLSHDGPYDVAGLGVGGHFNEGSPSQGAHGVEDNVAQQLDPHIMADMPAYEGSKSNANQGCG